ncbi:hypothetical protein QUF75_05150 [Desulfococcaceae bacterium HSG7]|nr:hypothetical protein [Desulfococcaceae bacterium HSG7]
MTSERHFQSLGNEVWILDICDQSGDSIADWESMRPKLPWQIKDTGRKDDTRALIASEPAEISLNVPQEGTLRLLKHPWSGVIEIESQGRVQKIDLFAPEHDAFIYQLGEAEHQAYPSPSSRAGAQLPESDIVKIAKTQIVKICEAHPDAIAIVHPQWRGVRKSVEELFNYVLYLEDSFDEEKANRIAEMIAASGCTQIVISGLPLNYRYLIEAIHHRKLNIKVFVIWHASFLQSNEEFNWQGFKIVHELCRKGLIAKWGFVKKGMAEAVAQPGVNTGFVMNYVRSVSDRASSHNHGGPHLGLWAVAPIWRKSPYAMMAAVSRIPNAELLVVGQNERAQEFGEILGLKVVYQSEPTPQTEMPAALARMHLNLYVTLSECAPMLPLESLAAGVPCLIGPSSHLFEDHHYLHSRLVVPYPDRSDIIAQYIQQALEERNQIVDEYIRYAPEYNRRARQSLCDFLEISTDSAL